VIAEYLGWRGQFCDGAGELLPQYRPAPLIPSFMRPPGDAEVFDRSAIPVPKGPVEVW
jgi:tRNA-dihydrouridine synthase B